MRCRLYGCERKKRTSRLITKLFVISLFLIIPILTMVNVSADGGMIPYHEFSVYEPGQKAIIAWDGQQEIMILSVDVYSEQNTKAIHMVPFPSLPEVELGSFESFDKIEEIMNRGKWKYDSGNNYNYGNDTIAPSAENVEIVFHEKIGAHDITAVKINSPIEFTDWVNNFLEGKGITNKKLPDELDTVVAHYTNQNIRYFVFDVIELEPNTKTVNPIIYKFKTNYLIFPLEISSIIEGSTEITLALITPDDLPINSISLKELGFDSEYDGLVSNEDLFGINKDIAKMFDETSCLRVYREYFSLKNLKDDVVIKRLTNVNWMIVKQSSVGIPKIDDLNGDGSKEIIVKTRDGIYVYDASNGKLNFEVTKTTLNNKNVRSYQIGDVNSDGVTDAIYITWNQELEVYDGKTDLKMWYYDISKENGPYPYNSIKYLGESASKNVIFYTGTIICSLNGKSGTKLWEHELRESSTNSISEIFVIRMDSTTPDIFVKYYNGSLSMLDGDTGNELWIKQLPWKGFEILCEDVARGSNREIICRGNDELYVIDSQTGTYMWTTLSLPNKWNRIYNLNFYDFNNDGFSEIYIFENPKVYVLDGNTGELNDTLQINVEELGTYIKQMEIGDFDNDDDIDYISVSTERLVIQDEIDGPIIWNFTTGESIWSIKVEDLDDDNNDEIVMTTNTNRLYTIEYAQGTGSGGNGEWYDNRGIIIGSILIPVLIIVIILLLIVRAFDKKRLQ